MGKNKYKKVIKIFSIFIVLFTLLIFSNEAFGYQITYYLDKDETLEENTDDWPDLYYRHITSAYTNSARDWTYDTNGSTESTDARWYTISATHNTKLSFKRYFEYFHSNINSVYDATGSGKARYYASGYTTWGLELPAGYVHDAKPFYSISSETNGYNGVYWGPSSTSEPRGKQESFSNFGWTGGYNGINLPSSSGFPYWVDNDDENGGAAVVIPYNIYRYGRTYGSGDWLYVTDNILTSNVVKKLYEVFPDEFVGKDGKHIYQSSILRTHSSNGNYYEYMDTAFKFWETTVKGKKGDSWTGSGSTNLALSSFVNHYDNTMIMPEVVNKTKIYVRHVDTSNCEVIKYYTIGSDSAKLIKTSNPKAFTLSTSNWNVSDGFVNPGAIPTEYSEYYEKTSSTQLWRIPNLLNNSQTLGSAWNNLTAEERNEYSDYTCVGAVIGKGNTLEDARSEKDRILMYNTDLRKSTTPFTNANYTNSNFTSAFDKRGNDTAVIIKGTEDYDYIVIDFYYDKAKDTDVYVRHLDVTDINNTLEELYGDSDAEERMPTNTGRALLGSSIVSRVAANIVKPEGVTAYTYQEKYQKTSGNNLTLYNIRHSNYYNYLSWSNRNTYSSYVCVGSAIGRGNRVDLAEVNRDSNVRETFGGATSKLTSSNNNLTVSITDNENSKVVVDFYYKKLVPQISIKKVYVRHIDITGIDKSALNYNKTLELINNNKILNGKGSAIENYSTWSGYSDRTIYKDKLGEQGYQEVYNIEDNSTLKVSKDLAEVYECVGYNMVSGSSLSSAVTNLTSRLSNSQKYSDIDGDSVTTSRDSSKDYVIIDFYYKNLYEGEVIDREKLGRLAYYTDDYAGSANTVKFGPNVNGKTTDVIPSGEMLKMSVDNAATYMLGAINIKEQSNQGTYTITYKITQKYTVDYLDWDSYCTGICGRTYSNYKSGSCTATGINLGDDCRSRESCTGSGESKECTTVYYCGGHSCNGTWIPVSTPRTYTGSTTVTYVYQIPYKNIYYKVKNMRLYRISKIELLDGYSNDGLPLFDGMTHTTTPVSEYGDSFTNNVTFNQSNSKLVTSSTLYKTLNTTLDFDYTSSYKAGLTNNATSDISTYDITTFGSGNIQDIFTAHIDHSEAAKMTSVTKEGEHTNGTSIEAELYVNNDQYKFKDGVKTSRVVTLVGDASKSTSYTRDDSTIENSYTRNEFSATKKINLSNYTAGKTRNGTTSGFTYNVNEDDRVTVATQYPNNVTYHYNNDDIAKSNNYPDNYPTDYTYYNKMSLTIPEDRVNGKRYSYGKIYYNLVSNSDLNFDVKDSNVKDGQHSWTKTQVNGANGDTFIDTEMYRAASGDEKGQGTIINGSSLGQIVWEYGKNKTDSTEADVVNVFTPVSFKTWVRNISVSNIINHTNQAVNNQIQKNSRFTIDIKAQSNDKYKYGATNNLTVDTSKYISQYYIKFDFDVQDVKITDANGTDRSYNFAVVPKETWIGPIYNRMGTSSAEVSISAFALADPLLAESVVNQEKNRYWVRAVGYNAPTSLINAVKSGTISNALVDRSNNEKVQSTLTSSSTLPPRHDKYYTLKTIRSDSNFVAEATVSTENMNRVYDFKITDLKDIDWKDIFRTSSTTTTNVHTSEAYYSGIRKWNIYTTALNDMVIRDASEIGSTRQQTLPLGPYKNTNTTYVKAPKLGYRFSFDLKTTGKVEKKKVVITPSFYFVYKTVPTGGERVEKNIKLLYKNSNNKYVDISNYKLYFVPDDGYRLTFRGTDAAYRFSSSSLSKASTSLGTATKLTLTDKMMQEADSNFVQIWYGEYKLPNSTVAVKTDAHGEYNINEDRLTNGYIAVKFDIEVIENYGETDETIISYLKNNNAGVNTSQWDYEGYLGATAGVENNNLRIPLEGSNGTWTFNNNIYNDVVKGTVILYDADAKASSDYN